MIDAELDYMTLSGIQHFAFCRRQWALIHIEGLWNENVLTFEGREMHERAHDPFASEKRGSVLTMRDMPVFSKRLWVQGNCDIVEFKADESGVELFGRTGKWSPAPVEYKHGAPSEKDMDRLQLCAQAICLEEMLLCKPIGTAYIYYGKTRHRETVPLTAELREEVEETLKQMRCYGFERVRRKLGRGGIAGAAR